MRSPPREELVARFAPGRSFLDVGAMWNVHGAIAFAARDAGATRVTALDIMERTPEFTARQGDVRFVHGDLHDPRTVEAAGVHDVVWCSGVLYHAPHPLLTLQRLRELTGATLLLATETIRRRGRAAIFAPDPREHPALHEPLDPKGGYRGWWWGLSPGAVIAMAEATGFAVAEEHRTRHHQTLVLQMPKDRSGLVPSTDS
jgi:hypothetical protein